MEVMRAISRLVRIGAWVRECVLMEISSRAGAARASSIGPMSLHRFREARDSKVIGPRTFLRFRSEE